MSLMITESLIHQGLLQRFRSDETQWIKVVRLLGTVSQDFHVSESTRVIYYQSVCYPT
jgi:hypothetical protein